MSDDLHSTDASFLLQTELQEAERALASLSPKGIALEPHLADRRSALLQWKLQLEDRVRAVDRQIAAELSKKSEQAQRVSHRDHQMAVGLRRELEQARETSRRDYHIAVEMSRESDESQAGILRDIQRREAFVARRHQAAGVPQAQARQAPQGQQASQEPRIPQNQQAPQATPAPQSLQAPQAPRAPQAIQAPQAPRILQAAQASPVLSGLLSILSIPATGVAGFLAAPASQAPAQAPPNQQQANTLRKRKASDTLSERPEKRPRTASASQEQAQAPPNQQQANTLGKRQASHVLSERPEKRSRTAQTTVPQVRHDCAACAEQFPELEMITNSCLHRYCRGCLGRLLENSLVDESLFPPRCCRIRLPLDAARTLISNEMWNRFEEKKIEHSDQSRTYCSNPACSKYILPTQVRGRIAICSACTRETCTRCKTLAHYGRCPNPDEDVLTLARDEGWRRCSNCGHLVELRSGCNHITCRCGYEYCYVCAVRWKECDCEQWDEARLLEDIAIRRARQQAGQFIFDRDECEHDVVWKKIRRAGACEHCGDWMRAYILECRDCGFRACRTCRTNF